MRRDAQLDRPRADLPRPDAAKPKPDLPKVDLPAIPDLPKQDAGGAVGCAAGAVRIAFEPASGMDPAFAYCSQSTPVNQCTAQLLCASGWQLCPALTYQKKHGASTPPPTTIQAWIAGHVRNNGTPYAPQDGLVLCTLLKTTWADTSWFCNGTANDQQQQAYVGLSTYAQCRRVGTSTAATEAHWQTFAAVDGNNVKAAVCCK